MQHIHYLQYNTITYATKIQMLTLLTLQSDNSSCLAILNTITSDTWNKIQLLILLKPFTPLQNKKKTISITALYRPSYIDQVMISEQCLIFHCIWSLV